MKRHQSIANFLALALLPLSGFATDIYVPALPRMAESLHVSGLQIQVTITLYLVSYGISQLFIGSVLDSLGRYRIGLASLMLFSLASLVIALTHSLSVIYAMRIVQGVTVGAVIAGKRAYFVDLFTGDRLKHYLSLFSIIWSTGPIVAPFVGGWLQTAFGWEMNFYLLAVVGAGFTIAELLFSGETLPNPTPFRLGQVVNVYAGMLRTSEFILGIVLLGLSYSMVMVYNMTGPFVIEHHLQLSVVTAGYCSLIMGFAWMVGGFISKATIGLPFFRKLLVNNTIQMVLVLVMLVCVRQVETLSSLVIFAFLIHVCAGYTFNNYMTFCLTRFPHNAGVASGLTGGVTFLIVSSLSYGIVNFFPAKDALNLGYSYLVFILLTALVIFFAFRGMVSRRKPAGAAA
ncbi:MFS transporter [Puia dinghuensis]|uniref:Bcr/CflA family drug resistance efflux transporter n=1 Tax=Puia dinghuensis TaxID=1792502 RepID=A0A8J2UHA7_9BACT|nr:MFS transporter [Puia dinghuensis]GGB18180.1 Bcr/CflA family drug resistance efflux transporter [Puia dinghuensis]